MTMPPAVEETRETAPSPGQVALRVGAVWAALTLAWTLVGVVRHEILRPHLSYDVAQVVQALFAGVLGVGVVVLACKLIDRRTIASLGLGSLRQEWPALAKGAGLWLGLAVVGLAVGVGIGAFRLEFGAPNAAFVGWFVLQLGLVFCYEALPEELALRGYVFTNLRARTPRWVAVLGQAVVFMLWAFAFVGLLQLLGYDTSWSLTFDRVVLFLTFGITLALVRLWTGSLWGSIGYHLAYQTITQLMTHDRLVVVRTPGENDLLNAQFFLWIFPIAIGGLLVLGLLRRRGGTP
ncbi:lysostaphin resistance A-like protein [Kribbella sp. CA-247076]|uniref:CPBP family intramembrane glutamic endopeptidase n=1 Tax=Kribbella sp. CA-247076 TaxID=3239941 RepID=UPI003D92EB28